MRFKVLIFLLTFRRFWVLITGIVIESEHVLTICDGNSISHTRKGETIPQCPELPSPEGFFDAPRRILYEEKCKNDDSSFVRDSNGETTVIQYGILALKWLIDGLRHQLNQLIDTLLRFVADDLLGFTSIAKNWSTQWHIILICVFTVLFHLKDGSRIKKLWKSSLLGLISSSALLLVYSYYQKNIWITLVFLLMATFAMSPCCPVAFRGLGTLTILQLFIPLLGTILKLFLNIQLFLGPILNCFINGASILLHIICLIGLFVDEKLMILKVLLLPLYQTFTNLFIHNDKHSALLDSIRKSVEELSSGLMGGGATGGDGQQLGGSFHNQLRRLCENTTLSWYATCPSLFARSCKDFADRTVPAQADQALQTAGQWLTDALSTPIKQQNVGTVQRSASKTICQKMSDSVCRIVDLSGYCKPDETFYGSAYDFFNNSLEKLKNIILIQPWIKLKSIFRIPEESSRSGDLFNFNLIPILYRSLRICLALLAFGLLFRALVQAFLFLRRYRSDPSTFRNYKIDWMRCSVKSGMLVRIIIWFLIEEAFQSLHEKLQNIRFRVPENGDARFAFNVQGNGTIAAILSSVLGKFDLQSRYCTVADTAVCSTIFFPLGWKSWTALFTLGSLYTFTDILARHADYWMSFLCSRFFFPKSTKTIISKLKIEKRRKRVEDVEQWAEKTLESSDPEENKRLLTFFHRYRISFCRLRFAPTLFLSLIAHYRFRITDIHCQICFHHLITTQFRDCHSLLFCNECSSCLKCCPCCHRKRRIQVE